MILRNRRFWLTLLVAAALVPGGQGCAVDRLSSKASAAAVRINDEEIPYREFETYLRANFGDETPADDAETRSRLFDQFVEERLLLQQARGKDLQVSDTQVDEYLAGLGGGADDGNAAVSQPVWTRRPAAGPTERADLRNPSHASSRFSATSIEKPSGRRRRFETSDQSSVTATGAPGLGRTLKGATAVCA